MTLRRPVLFFACLIGLALPSAMNAAEFTTENFVVTAPNAELAKTFGEYAEKYRQQKALEWLGQEMPRWRSRCPLVVKITMNRTGGATTFTFSDRQRGVMTQEMEIFGDVPQLLNSVLPHEVTHTVLAHHFGQPVPRWADEGGSVLSENEKERYEHDIKCREFLNQGRGISLSHLFPMKQYPRDMIVLYAQGYSVSQYLIDLGGAGLKGRQKFLGFLEEGMKRDGNNWDRAVEVYGFSSVDDLQKQWIESLRKPPVRLAARGKEPGLPTAAPATFNRNAVASSGMERRSSALAALPQLEPPVVARGAMPAYDSPLTPERAPLTAPALTPSSRSESMPIDPAAMPRLLPPELPTHR
jgi:hypothetical protein